MSVDAIIIVQINFIMKILKCTLELLYDSNYLLYDNHIFLIKLYIYCAHTFRNEFDY